MTDSARLPARDPPDGSGMGCAARLIMDKPYLSFKVNTLENCQQGFKLPNGLKFDKNLVQHAMMCF